MHGQGRGGLVRARQRLERLAAQPVHLMLRFRPRMSRAVRASRNSSHDGRQAGRIRFVDGFQLGAPLAEQVHDPLNTLGSARCIQRQPRDPCDVVGEPVERAASSTDARSRVATPEQHRLHQAGLEQPSSRRIPISRSCLLSFVAVSVVRTARRRPGPETVEGEPGLDDEVHPTPARQDSSDYLPLRSPSQLHCPQNRPARSSTSLKSRGNRRCRSRPLEPSRSARLCSSRPPPT